MDVILHLGAHRTATASFQAFLRANHVPLARAGLTCWTPTRTRDGLLAGLVRDPALITIEDERKAARSIGRIRIEVERLARAEQTALLISDANILGCMANNLADMRLYPLLRERLMRFVPAFDGRALRIGLCVRSFDEYWASVLAYYLPRGGSVPDQDLLDCLTTQPRRWRTLVRRIAVVFPDAQIVVWPFERFAGQPRRQLAALWDGNASSLTGSMDDAACWRNRANNLAALNAVLALRGERPLRRGPLDANARWMPFSEDQLAVLRADYRRDIAWFKSGAEGLATFIDGRPTRAMATHNLPDRAIDHSTGGITALHIGGHNNGIEKGLGRTGAS